ncbi:MAG: tetratricopeptide repeat protein [Bryobacteraceae bacterium]|nr:tetratricopeptide repeat protein [Bryobacteraceae bacterium]
MRYPQLLLLAALALFAGACNRDPKVQRQKYLESGNRYFNNSKFKEASIMYRRALQQDMRFGEAYYRLGLSELRLGRPVDALRALQRAVELEPDNQDAPAKLAELFLAAYTSNPKHPAEFLKEVEDNAKKILTRNPKSYDGLRLRGYVNLAKKDLDGAVADFRAANEAKPNQPDLTLVLCQTLVAKNEAAEAEKIARAEIERERGYAPLYDLLYALYARGNRIPEAEEILKLKSSNNPRNPVFILQLAGHYIATKNPAAMQQQIERITSNSKDFPTGRLLVGDFFFRIRQLDKAMEQYRTGLASAKDSDKPLYRKREVEVLVAQGKVTEANALVAELLKANPKDDDALAIRGALALRSGSREQIQQAINDLQSVVSRSPENPVLRFNLARALLAKGELDQARVQLLEAIKLRADFVPPRLALAQIYVTKGDFPNAQATANEILQYDPNNVAGKLLRSSSLIGLKQYVEARQELNALLDTNPALADAQFQLGMVNYGEGKLKDAEAAFRKLYQTTPNDPRGLLGTVESLVSQKDFPKAMEMLNAEIKKAPERQDLRLALANTAYRAKNFDMAIEEYKKLIEKNPKEINLMIRLGEAYRLKGDPRAAISIVQKAEAMAPPNNPVPTLTLAMLLETVGEMDKSKPHYEKVLQIEPDNAMALNNLAYIMAEQGTNLDQALTMVQKAKQKLPNNPEVADTLGWIYIKKNLADSAIGIFTDLVRTNPERSTFHYHLAMAYFQKGDKPKAKQILQTALSKNPAKPEEAKIRELMAKCG